MKDFNQTADIGHPVKWLSGFLAIVGASALMAWVFFKTIQTLTSVALHCRACG